MSTLKVDTLTTTDAANTIATERVANGTAAAWVNFDGTGTVAIRAAYNVSSITDYGTGIYGVNYINQLPDANMSIVSMAQSGTSAVDSLKRVANVPYAGVDRHNVKVGIGSTDTATDFDYIYSVVFR